MTDNQFDIIFIGSGIGTLCAASLIAQSSNQKILILEQHFKPGGFTHTFKRKQKYLWDVGVHYIGDLDENSMTRKIFDVISDRQLKWNRMPEGFDKFVYPDFSFTQFSAEEKFKQDLIQKFPAERKSIIKYFSDISRITNFQGRRFAAHSGPWFVKPFANLTTLLNPRELAMTTKQYLDENFTDYKLKALLTSQWGDYGLPPSKSSFIMSSLVVHHYLNGAWYPQGSAQNIYESISKVFEKNDVEVKLSHKVDQILVKDKRAVGVTGSHTNTGERFEYYADKIVSNTGAENTFLKLLPPDISSKFKDRFSIFQSDNATSVSLYLGLKSSPAELGLKGENWWIFQGYDHDLAYQKKDAWPTEKPPLIYLSLPSLKDNQNDHHTAEIISFSSFERFAKWKEQPWKKRDQDYQTLKEKMTKSLISIVEEKIPGFREIIEYSELSTPLSNLYFGNQPRGGIYGTIAIPERFNKNNSDIFSVTTPIKNLYQTGADAATAGIAGALAGGMLCAGEITAGASYRLLF
ncbi:MAG: NAD(P)/FAD-dependent oxidoreductase [Leptospiraceae bacterium]|nr:NAD(P)/FAD-dependent oxidoreductase [Leptospiraceae bacterium]